MIARAGNPRLYRRTCALLALLLVINLAGCVQRRMTIRSNPPGAMVYIDDYQIGTTPVATDYVYYGTRKIRLVKDGYETLTAYQPMPAPWYQWLGIDFFSENIWPGEIRDERAFAYQMSPMTIVPPDQLIGRAEQLRAASRVVPAVAPAPILPSAAPPAVAIPNTAPPSYAVPGGYFPGGTAPVLSPSELPAPTVPFNAPPSSTIQPYTYPAPPLSNPPAIYSPPGGALPSPAISPAVPSSQPALPPDWRPIGQAPTAIQR